MPGLNGFLDREGDAAMDGERKVRQSASIRKSGGARAFVVGAGIALVTIAFLIAAVLTERAYREVAGTGEAVHELIVFYEQKYLGLERVLNTAYDRLDMLEGRVDELERRQLRQRGPLLP